MNVNINKEDSNLTIEIEGRLDTLTSPELEKEVEYGGGAGSFIVNVVWFIFSGIELAIMNAFMGLLLCITIIGLPFGLQFFKIAKLSLAPFGASVVRVE